MDIPVYCDVAKISAVKRGATLVEADENSASSAASALVCVVTRAEHVAGYTCNQTVPFIINGIEHLPPQGGTWFEVASTGCAVRAWADAHGESAVMPRYTQGGSCNSKYRSVTVIAVRQRVHVCADDAALSCCPPCACAIQMFLQRQ